MTNIPEETRQAIQDASRRGWELLPAHRNELLARIVEDRKQVTNPIDLFLLDQAELALSRFERPTKPRRR